MKPSEIVRSYYAAFDNKDLAQARALLHDKFRFVGPMMTANSPEELFEQMKGMQCQFTNNVKHIAENGDTVGALVDCVFTHPFQATIRMSEWFTVENGKITSSNLVYDTRQMPTMACAAS